MGGTADMGTLPPFGGSEAFARWEFHPVITAAAVLVGALYLWGDWRVARRHPARPWPWWRTLLFLGGLLAVVAATESGIGVYASVLFWDHMIQHLLLIMVAPAMLVAAQPLTLLLHASRNPLHTRAKRVLRSRPVTWLTWPPACIAAYAATIVGTHLTGLMNVVMSSAAAADGEHALYLGTGCLFFLPLIGREPIRWRISYPMRILTLFLVMPVDTLTGLVLGYASTGMSAAMRMHRSWGPSAVDDMHAGGAVMWIGGAAIMLALIMLTFLAWSMDDRVIAGGHGWLESARRASLASLTGTGTAERAQGAPAAAAPRHGQGRGGVDDDDEHLAAYNAFLARINEGEHGRQGSR
jgi:putative copper resistance protein D